ncbi:MAG: cation:proton antiporter [Prochlorococcus sp.]
MFNLDFWLASVPQGKAALAIDLPKEFLLTCVAFSLLGALVASKLVSTVRIPSIVGVLLLGALISPNAASFSPGVVDLLHAFSLAMLLFYEGLRTDFTLIRGQLGYGIALAIGGVVVSSSVLGILIWLVYQLIAGNVPGTDMLVLPIGVCFMMAACIGSTDAGATMNVLRSITDVMPARLRSIVQLESTINDPTAFLFLSIVIGLVVSPVSGGMRFETQLADFLQEIANGILIGLILTYVAQLVLVHVVSGRDQILVVGVSIAMASYGLASLFGGSGFISAYVTGLFLSNNVYENRLITPELLENSFEPFNTLTELSVFLMFGILIDPSQIPQAIPEGLAIALCLMLIARPLSVLVYQFRSPLSLRESLLVSWCGLRGAVPLALTYEVVHVIPQMRGLSAVQAESYQVEVTSVIFVVVVFNLLIQGISLPMVARRLLGLTPQADKG